MNRRTLNFTMSLVAGIALLACDKATDISGKGLARMIVGRCLLTKQTLFIVERTSANQKFPKQTGVLLVPPGSSWAPPSVAAFTSGAIVAGPDWRVIGAVPSGTRLVTERVWRLESFEGAFIGVQARMSSGQVVDISWLMNPEWKLPFYYDEEGRFGDVDLFDTGFVTTCVKQDVKEDGDLRSPPPPEVHRKGDHLENGDHLGTTVWGQVFRVQPAPVWALPHAVETVPEFIPSSSIPRSFVRDSAHAMRLLIQTEVASVLRWRGSRDRSTQARFIM